MNKDRIKELLFLMKENDIEEIEISGWGRKIRISKSAGRHVNAPVPFESSPPAQTVKASAAPVEEQPEDLDHKTLLPIKSPMVGTFYRAPAPEAEPYVAKGAHVSVGTTVCLIEAMKLMNEIESEVEGTVEDILAENGKPVQYGQVLFLIRPG